MADTTELKHLLLAKKHLDLLIAKAASRSWDAKQRYNKAAREVEELHKRVAKIDRVIHSLGGEIPVREAPSGDSQTETPR